MAMTAGDLIQARQLISRILDELHIDAYLFEIEPRDGHWELKVECAVDEGWGSYSVMLDDKLLHEGSNGDEARLQLQAQCRHSLNECRKSAGGG